MESIFKQATVGLRQLGVDASERILQSVKDFLKVNSNLKSSDDWVTVLDGTQEGAYQWVTINYLLKRLGQKYSHTVGVIDLGGGSVQMTYAISEADVAKAPRLSNGEDTYVKEMFLMGTKYYLYVHSYLKYGLLAVRAETKQSHTCLIGNPTRELTTPLKTQSPSPPLEIYLIFDTLGNYTKQQLRT